jgi:hypothetical protein
VPATKRSVGVEALHRGEGAAQRLVVSEQLGGRELHQLQRPQRRVAELGSTSRAAITARQARDDALSRGLGAVANGMPYRSRNINWLLAMRSGVNPCSA